MANERRFSDLTPDMQKRLRAMYALEQQPRTDGGLDLSVEDHFLSTQKSVNFGISPEQQAETLNVSLSYVLAFRSAVNERAKP
jgi:hypothetical protein